MRSLIAAVLLLLPSPAWAAAWMRKDGSWEVISSAIFTDARHSFGNGRKPGGATMFERGLLQTDTQYGWNDRVTLVLRTETANVHLQDAGNHLSAISNAVEAGMRYHLGDDLLADYDVLSVEATARAAGAFNFSVSANGQAGGQAAGMRILYGAPFKLAGKEGFVDAELAQRWLTRPRPDETAMDLTAGLWLTPVGMIMLQSFNLFSGPARAPYIRFRTHKLQASFVWRWSPRTSFQVGGYFSPAGANALQESGLVVSLWTDF
jgi:hypothetical protein